MKFDILEWAYEAELPATIKGGPHAVLIALAYSANFKTEACFPSIRRLSHLTRLKDTAVKSGIKILKKEGLITVQSGKGKKKSNRYTINYCKIDRKGASSKAHDDKADSADIANVATSHTHQTDTDSDYEKHLKSADSDQVLGCNAATNEEHTNLNRTRNVRECSSSINSLHTNEEDDHSHTSTSPSIMTYNYDGYETQLLLGRGKHKPVGLAKAKKLVNEWFQQRGEERFGCKLENMAVNSMANILADAISMYTTPPDISFRDIENLLDILKEKADWDILEETIKNVKQQACAQQIDNPRAYIIKAFEENVYNGTAERVL